MIYFLSFLFFFLLSCCSSIGFVFNTGILRLRRTSLSSTNIPTKQWEATPHIYNGLLYGLLNISSAIYYSLNAPISESAELVKNNRLLYDIIEGECESDQSRINEYLQKIFEQMNQFMKKNKVWDRSELIHGLNMATETAGCFACLLGGKSTGKSLVLGELSRNNMMNRKVIYIDMREYSGITQGLVDVLSKSKIAQFQNLSKEFVKNVLAIAKLKVSDLVEIDVRALLGILLKDSDPNTALKTLIDDIVCGCPNECITLVLDEANLPLTINDRTSEAKIEEVKATLSLFTTLTKQQKKVNYQMLLLISSPVIIALQYYLL